MGKHTHDGGTLRLRDSTQAEPDPAPVRLMLAHGFVNEYGAVYFKPSGSIITNPIEIAVLRERGALLEAV